MAYNRNQARPLLTKAEYQLFEESLSDRIGSFTAAQLRAKVDRARRLADKYRDLYRRQSRSTRDRTGSGRGTSGAANERTDRKATILGEALGRFETQLDKVEAREGAGGGSPPRRGAGRAASKKGETRAKRRTTRAVVKSDDAAAARKSKTTNTPRNTKISAHVRAAGKRRQTRRDSR
jgi:hypothetical protein